MVNKNQRKHRIHEFDKAHDKINCISIILFVWFYAIYVYDLF